MSKEKLEKEEITETPEENIPSETEQVTDEQREEQAHKTPKAVEEFKDEGGVSDVVENTNEVIPEAVEKVKEERASGKEENFEKLDAWGFKFDPALHVSDKDGKPVLNRDGYLKRKRGRKSEQVKQKLNLGDAVESVDDEEKRKQAAILSAHGFVQVGVLIFGNEWLPEKTPYDEEKLLIQSFDDYYKVKGVADIPPGIALAIGLGGYGLKRLAKPVTKSKAALIWGGIKQKFSAFAGKIKKRGKKHGSQSDIGNDAAGKDDTSEADS